MSTPREDIMDSLMQAVFAVEGIKGCIDDLPPLEYATPPPKPRPGFGDPYLPFAYVFEGEEPVDGSEFGVIYQCELPVTVEIIFEYSRNDGERGLKRIGRQLLGKLQEQIMVDPNRGQRAQNTVESVNAVEETDAEGIGVAVWKGTVSYARSRLNPADNVALLSAA